MEQDKYWKLKLVKKALKAKETRDASRYLSFHH